MGYTCDGCLRTNSTRADATTGPRGWRVELTRDLCDLCVKNAAEQPWTVTLPAELRAHFVALAEAFGTSPEVQLERYLSADRGLVDMAEDARQRVAARAEPSYERTSFRVSVALAVRLGVSLDRAGVAQNARALGLAAPVTCSACSALRLDDEACPACGAPAA